MGEQGGWRPARLADVTILLPARTSLPCRLGVPYGPTRDEYLDIFPSAERAPVHIFIHGGYWRRFTAREHSFVAPPLVAAGVTACLLMAGGCGARRSRRRARG